MKEKIPFYDIANMFFTGAVFSTISSLLVYDKIQLSGNLQNLLSFCKDWSVIVGTAVLIIMFEIGLILNKAGSVLLGKLFEKTLWPKTAYSIKVSELEKENEKFKSLNTELHVVRTHILMYFLLAILALIMKKWIPFVIFIVFVVMFIFAGKRTNKFMNKIKEDYEKSSK